jgi:hypothetical protein
MTARAPRLPLAQIKRVVGCSNRSTEDQQIAGKIRQVSCIPHR